MGPEFAIAQAGQSMGSSMALNWPMATSAEDPDRLSTLGDR
jgi:hypothetical protein